MISYDAVHKIRAITWGTVESCGNPLGDSKAVRAVEVWVWGRQLDGKSAPPPAAMVARRVVRRVKGRFAKTMKLPPLLSSSSSSSSSSLMFHHCLSLQVSFLHCFLSALLSLSWEGNLLQIAQQHPTAPVASNSLGLEAGWG